MTEEIVHFEIFEGDLKPKNLLNIEVKLPKMKEKYFKPLRNRESIPVSDSIYFKFSDRIN